MDYGKQVLEFELAMHPVGSTIPAILIGTAKAELGASAPVETNGLIGIGLLGSALAERLIGAKLPLAGYDVDPAGGARLRALGGRSLESAAGSGAGLPAHSAQPAHFGDCPRGR